VRSLENSPIAVPLEWSEISYKNFDPQKYTVKNIFRRLGPKKTLGKTFMTMLFPSVINCDHSESRN